ncbi:MAG: hypothetical protein ACRD0M_11065 [Acidimicrobiales bacterium]
MPLLAATTAPAGPDPFTGLQQVAGRLAGDLLVAGLVLFAVGFAAAMVAELAGWPWLFGVAYRVFAASGVPALGGVMVAAAPGPADLAGLTRILRVGVIVAVVVAVVVAYLVVLLAVRRQRRRAWR